MSGNQDQPVQDLMEEYRAPDYTPDYTKIYPNLQRIDQIGPRPSQRQQPQPQPQPQFQPQQLQPQPQQQAQPQQQHQQSQPQQQRQQPQTQQQRQQQPQQQQRPHQAQRPSINVIAEGLQSRLQSPHPNLDSLLATPHVQQRQSTYSPPQAQMHNYDSNSQHYLPQQQAHIQQHVQQPQQQGWYAAIAFNQSLAQQQSAVHQQTSPGPGLQNTYYPQHHQHQHNDVPTNCYDPCPQQTIPVYGVVPLNTQMQHPALSLPRPASTHVLGTYSSAVPDWQPNRRGFTGPNVLTQQSSGQQVPNQAQQTSPIPPLAHSASPRLAIANQIRGRQTTSPAILAPRYAPVTLQQRVSRPRGPRPQERTSSVQSPQLRGHLIAQSVANIIQQQPQPTVRAPVPQQTNQQTTLQQQPNSDNTAPLSAVPSAPLPASPITNVNQTSLTPPATIVNAPTAPSPVTVNPTERSATAATQAQTNTSLSTATSITAPPATAPTATNTSVTSTTRPSSVEASPPKIETFNKACQVRLLVKPETVNRALMVAPEVAERWCQTDAPKVPEVKTYVDRASSPILFQTNVKTKQTPKRRRVEEDKDSDGEIDVG